MCGWKNNAPAAKLGRRARRLILIGLVAAGVVAGCRKTEAPAAGRVLRISQRNEPSDLDPARASLPDELFVIRALSEGLVAPSPDNGAPQPAAAESWDISPDGLAYTFHLRKDARWSNGEAVTAADFVASFERVLTPATAAPKAPLLFMVRNARDFAAGKTGFASVGFHAADPGTLTITLEHPMPRFLAYVASGPWIPVNPRIVEKFGRNWTRPENFVGNGAFTLTEWHPHQRIVVRRNPGYHAANRVLLDEIRFLAFDNGDAEERAFRAGQLDVTMAIPFTKLDTYQQEHPGEAHRGPLAETRYLSFNTGHAPLNDPRVRRALSLALNRAVLAEKVLHGGQQPTMRFVPPALRAADDADDPVSSADSNAPNAARALLAAAGFPGGRKFPRLELSTWPINAPISEAIQAMWKKTLGIDVSLVSREAKVHIAALRDGTYDVAFMTAIPDVADAANLLSDFTTDSPGNYPHWSDAAYDGLIRDAGNAADASQQARVLRQAEVRLTEESPLAPLYFNTTNWLMRPGVRGWHQDALWTRFYQDVSIDEKK
ncbi:MAG: extracellular solute-binding protein family 5 [Verrucomicrobia bacterium]|nr:extracellular solute-binding protein family 5 [Verrucomicrobiota bacterium]